MTSTFDWAKYENPQPEAQASFDWQKYENAPKRKKSPFEPTWERGASVRNSFWKGIGKAATGVASLATNDLIPQGKANEFLEKALPTEEGTLEETLERGAQLLPWVAAGPGGAVTKLASLVGGTAGGQIAKENEAGPIGEALGELIGSSIPGLIGLAAKGISKALGKTAAKDVERLPSGLTKPRAVEAKNPRLGHIAKETQEKSIAKINEEASGLAAKTLEKERPLIRKIEAGHNFEAEFEKEFGQLKAVAEKSNPVIEVDPLVEFLGETYKKYKGIPSLHPEAEKIVKEIKAFAKSPQEGMGNLLKIYRSNNKKIKNIYETSRITGKQQEYVDFLTDMNRKITESFEKTLGKESPWVSKFRENNAHYKEYRDTLRARDLLEPILGKNPSPATIEKAVSDIKTQQKLRLALGEKGAEEIVQLAKDQKLATEAIKGIPVKELSKWEAYAPLSVFIPAIHGVTGAFTAHKALKFLRRGYGNFLTTPKSRKQYENVLKAIQSKDLSAYRIAVAKLIGTEDEEE